jgi:uncharacterized protein
MHPVVESRREAIAELCRRMGVKRLEVFGSAARDDFDEARSDVDFLVEFNRTDKPRGFDEYLDLKEALETMFQREVDLVETGCVKNPYVRADIDRFKQLVYAA